MSQITSYTNKAGATFLVGDVIHYHDEGGNPSKDYGIIRRFDTNHHSKIWCVWYDKLTGQASDYGMEFYMNLKCSVEPVSHYVPAGGSPPATRQESSTNFTVVSTTQQAVDFLIAQGYIVSLSRKQ